MCTIPDHREAISEAKRVLRPGGYLIILDHVRSQNPFMHAIQSALDPLFVRIWSDHLLRDPAVVMEHQGFAIERLERSKLGIIERVVARKPV